MNNMNKHYDLPAICERRVFGPPGTGKTTHLAQLIEQACREYGSNAVLVTSFTRAAAQELIQRGLPLDRGQVGTLHALCYRQLGRPKLAVGKTLVSWNTAYPGWSMEGGTPADLDDYHGIDFDRNDHRDGDGLFESYSTLRARMAPRETWPEPVQHFAEAWEDWKHEASVVDFTDLIERCRVERRLPPQEAVVLFADEVQDFSANELALVRQWGEHMHRIVLSGDDDQCIYAFKGASPKAFLLPDLPADRKQVLRESFRVPRAVHVVAARWIGQLQGREPKTYHPRQADGVVERAPGITWKYPNRLLDRLSVHREDGKRVAILATCGYMLNPLKRLLRERGVPFHNPYCVKRTDWNPLHLKAGTMSAVDRVLAYLRVNRGGRWTYQDVHHWAAVLDVDGVLTAEAKTAIRTAAEEEALSAFPVRDQELDAWFTDPTAPEAATSGNLSWYRERLLPSFERRMRYACRVAEDYGADALIKPDLILGTIHSVKGGEADVVYLFPDLSRRGYMTWISSKEGQDSVRRVFYVGVTRARETLYLLEGSGPSAPLFQYV
ncbi:UvrD-helicase domain-containing protein [Nitrospira sp. Nam74]